MNHNLSLAAINCKNIKTIVYINKAVYLIVVNKMRKIV